jgi:hypothetical protein
MFCFTWNAFDWNFTNTLAVTSKARMNFANLCLLSFYQLFQHLFLLSDNDAELSVDDLGVEFTPHQCCTLVVLYVALVDGLGEFNVLAETLLLKIADGKLVGES